MGSENTEKDGFHPKRVWVVLTIARQIQGEYVIAKAEKGFTQASKADEFVKNLARQYTETIATPSGNIECLCERGVFEVEID